MGSEVKFFHIFFRKKDRTQLLEIESSKKKLLHFAEAAFIIYCFWSLNHSLVKHSVCYFHKACYVSSFHVVNITVFLPVF